MEKLALKLDDLRVESFPTTEARRARGTVFGAAETDYPWSCTCLGTYVSVEDTWCVDVNTCNESCGGTCQAQGCSGPDNPDTNGCGWSQPSQVWTCQVGC